MRRLHDTDRSGWWYLIGLIPYVGIIILLVILAGKGTPGPNRYDAGDRFTSMSEAGVLVSVGMVKQVRGRLLAAVGVYPGERVKPVLEDAPQVHRAPVTPQVDSLVAVDPALDPSPDLVAGGSIIAQALMKGGPP